MNVLRYCFFFSAEETEDSDLKQPSLRIEVANLKEKVQELEEELALERNRGKA